MQPVFSLLWCYPGLLYLLLTSGYCFRFFCSFANKVALTKADLQGREGSCSLITLDWKMPCVTFDIFISEGFKLSRLLDSSHCGEGAETSVLLKRWQTAHVNAWWITLRRKPHFDSILYCGYSQTHQSILRKWLNLPKWWHKGSDTFGFIHHG